MSTVLISGAGIAGAAAAYWLDRFGFTATVVERAAAPRPGGHAVDLRGASPGVVERMGLLDTVRERALHELGMAHVDADGRVKARMPAEAFGGRGAVAGIEILRGDLAEILVDATRGRVEYRYGDRITELDQDADGVDVRFASGRAERYDLVIGADGAHSEVRSMVFGPEEQFVHPMGAHTAHFSISAERAAADGLDRDGWFTLHSVPDRRLAALRPDHGDGVKAVFMFGSDLVSQDDLHEPRTLLRRLFADVGWHAPAMLAAMDTAEDFYFDGYSQVKMPSWVSGRVVLLGDAGYCPSPISGQGTNLALVGAYVLAGELALAAAGGDPVPGLAAYQRVLADYVERNHELPPGGVKSMLPKSRLGITAGQVFMRIMTSRLLEPLAARMFAGHEEAFAPRDYPAELGRLSAADPA